MHQRFGVGFLFVLAVFAFVPRAEAVGDLVGHWKFDEASGSTATDSSGNGWNGTLSNVTRSTSTLPPVEFANTSSVFFNSASSDRIVSTSLSLNNYTQFTLAGWAYPTAANSRASWFGQNDIFEFGFSDNDTLVCYTAKGEVLWDFNAGTFLNNWHHITCLATPTELIMYIDGVNVGSASISAGSFGSSGSTFSIGAGVLDGGTQGPFTGYIDDVRVYSRGLSPSEMEGLGNGESGPTNAPSIESTSPTDNATGVSLTANLSLTFGTSTMATSTGSIGLYKTADNSLVESFSVSSSRLTRIATAASTTFTIDPTAAFDEGIEYYVSIASTTFRNGLNTFYEGTAASTTWSFTAIDSTSPTPSSITASSTATTTGISWTTAEAASTKVVFGLTTAYSSTTPEKDTSPRRTAHYQRLAPLAECTTYHYAVVSRDAAGNSATSTDSTFTTDGCEYDTTPTSATSTAITSTAGGEAEIEDDGKTFSVSAPANATATSSSFVIQVKAIPSDDVLASLGRPGAKPEEIGTTVFDVKAIIDGTTILDSFDHPVTITYEYTDGEISGIDESSLWLYHYHDGAWEALDDCDVDTGANTIECATESFSIFGLFGSQAQSTSGSSSGGGGTTIQGRVKNLLESGNRALAEQLMREYPQAFASVQTAAVAAVSGTCPKYTFTRSLKKGMTGDDVRALQQFLNCQGFKLGESGPGAPGSETNYFAQRTFDAVVKFQEKYASEILAPVNAAKGTGFFATYSIKKAQTLIGAENQ